MNDLFLLIKSLTAHEKRYFKVYSQRTTTSNKINNYVALFEAMDSFEEYDEDALLKKYRKAAFIKHFAAHKTYLYNAILKSLREYNEENIIEWQIREDYYRLKLLASKGLDKQCLKLIEKTKPLAWQYEQYSTLADIIELQLYLFGNCRIGNFDPHFLNELIAERERLYTTVSDYKYILNNWHTINILFQNINKENLENIHSKAKKIIEEPNMQRNRSHEDGLLLRLRYLACFELYYNGIGDPENCYKYNKLLVEHRKVIERLQPQTYSDPMATYFNFMIACYKYEKWAEMEEYLHLLKEYPCRSVEQQIRRCHNYAYCGLMLFVATKKYNQAALIIKEYTEAKVNFGSRVRLDFKIVIESLCGLTAFFKGNYQEAIDWWNDIIQAPKHNTELRTQGAIRVYRLLLLVATKEWLLLDSEIRNTRRFLQKNNLYNEQEQMLLKMIEKNLSLKTAKSTAESIHDLQALPAPILSETSVFNRFIIDALIYIKELN